MITLHRPTVPDDLMKLVERMPRVQRVATLMNLKINLDLFNTFFGYYVIPYVLFHSFELFYNVGKKVKNKEKPLIE